MTKYLLWAPVLNDTGKCRLFGIVANVWAKPIDSSAKVVI